jgi:uncharacterized protein
MAFQITGILNGSTQQQLINFSSTLNALYPDKIILPPKDWYEAFRMLQDYLEHSKLKKKVVFLDELPWMDTRNSNFISALGYFWNSWASARHDIVLVVCGSATSWMINKLIRNTGGLYNRVTKRIRLSTFTLKETEEYLKSKKIQLDRYQIMQIYMTIGGIPFYLNELRPGASAFQEIDRIFFTKNAMLRSEYNDLYHSLFNSPEKHIAIVEALAKKNKGMTREEIIKNSGLSNGGNTTKVLRELEESGFITRSYPFDKKRKTTAYWLTDNYSLFYLEFIKDKKATGEGSWLSRIDNPSWRAWSGYAYENICFTHVSNIKKALGISGVYTEISSWIGKEKGAQIDLILDRRDQVISLCEIKFSTDIIKISKAYAAELQKKIWTFREEIKTRKSIFLTLITTFGLEHNMHSLGFVQNAVTMDDLFAE